LRPPSPHLDIFVVFVFIFILRSSLVPAGRHWCPNFGHCFPIPIPALILKAQIGISLAFSEPENLRASRSTTGLYVFPRPE
jgi:hypothetical protein